MSMLRKATFERVLDKIHLEFGFDPLTDSKKRKYIQARGTLFYVCRIKKRIGLDELIELLDEKGYTIGRSAIIRSVNKMRELIKSDPVVKIIINEIAE